MKYSVPVERLGEPTLKLDGEIQQDIDRVAAIISSIIGIETSKVVYFIKNFGLNKVFDEPSIMGISPEQETIMTELKELILLGLGENINGDKTNDNVKSVRY